MANLENTYYHMQLDKTNLIIWLIISIIFTIATLFTGFIILIIPFFIWLGLKKRDYYYNYEKLIVESGILIKKQNIIPLYRIVNLSSTSFLWIGAINIQDKGQLIALPYVKNSRQELLKLTEVWEKAKKQNIRNEVI